MSLADGASSVAASSVRPRGNRSTSLALTVVATVGVFSEPDTSAVTSTVSVTWATPSWTLTGSRSAIWRRTACFAGPKPAISNVTV